MKKFYLSFLVITLCSFSATSQVVINEVYGGGGNSGSPYSNDFIELYNNGASPVSLAGWSVQYLTAGGAGTWAATNLTGSIQPGEYYLIQALAGATPSSPLPTPDAIGTLALSATAGKVILCNVTTLQTGANPTGTAIVDKVGYGAAATGFETAPAPGTSNTTSVFRIITGVDTDNNAADFQAGAPFPQNSAYVPDAIPPTIVSFSPADDAVNVATTSILTITFSEAVKKNVSVLSLNNATTGTTDYVYFVTTNPNVTISGSILTVRGINLQPGSSYNITFADTVISDIANNKFAGIALATTWNFSTAAVPLTPIAGVLNTTYNLNTSANVFDADGFKQYSTAGALVWESTTFGNPGSTTNAVQMNGFFAGTNVLNQDWFISPQFNLSATAFPLLSFYSITKFNGSPLQLKVSTDYPGYGNPNNYTWADINGKFPAQSSNVWTLSNNINLTAYKSAATYFAFVYNSSDDEGQRWTLDDIRVDNSAGAPPASLTITTSDFQFGYVASGGSLVKTFNITGNDITGDIVLTVNSAFTLSTDGVIYTPSVTLLQATSNNVTKTIYVKYSPTQNDINYNGTINVITAGVTTPDITVRGTSISPLKTLEVVNWNLEWFGSTNPTLGPTNDNLQEQNVKTVLQNIGADLYGLVEVVDETRLANIVSQMPGYAYVICNYGSHVNPPEPTGQPLSEAQKEAFVYKTSVFSNVSARALINNQNINSTSYYNWASGRYPFLMTADVTLNGITKPVDFVLLHAKANTAPVTPSYNRRKAASDELHDTLNTYFGARNVVVLGDFNDDLDVTIADGIVPNTTSYSAFTGDPSNFYSPTLALSIAGRASTVKYTEMIDHVYLSNEMQAYYLNNSANVLNDVAATITSYGTTTTDHYPVFTRYAFDPLILPITLTGFRIEKQGQSAKLFWATEQETNSSHFVIERSTDAKTWNSIATVNAAGNSSRRIDYSIYDNAPMKGINYYRLKQVDKDARYDYSVIRTALFSAKYAVEAAPNPAKDVMNIYLAKTNNKPATIQLLNAAGKIVYNAVSAQSHVQINTTGIGKGLYFVKVIDADEVTVIRVLVH